jgi:hypothetical protein
MVRHWWRRLARFARASSPGGRRGAATRPRFRPRVEALEDRLTPAVSYHNGPLLAHVEVQNVFLGAAWNSGPTLQPQSQQLDGYMQFLADSPYVGMLEQYSAGGQPITGGHWTGRDVYAGAVGGTIDDSTIQADLRSEIAFGRAQPNDPNRLYVVYTPAGTVVTNPLLGDSIHNFAGYHFQTIDNAGKPLYYAVIPYGGSPNYLNFNLSPFQQLTEVTSHELSEAITDPQVFVDASGRFHGTGWHDNPTSDLLGQEIGDIVNFQFAGYDGYIVQREWSNVDNKGILPGDRGAAAAGLFSSPEYLGDLVGGLYTSLLHRPAGANEISWWVNQIQTYGWSDETVIGKFLASAEYANLHGGTGNDPVWLQAIYQDELGRPASGSEVAAWLPIIQSQGREAVGYSIAHSTEAEIRMVAGYYAHYLHRAANSAELSYDGNLLANNTLSRETLQVDIVASNEYYDLQVRNTDGAHSTEKGWVDAEYLDILGRPVDPTGEAGWLNYLRQGGG